MLINCFIMFHVFCGHCWIWELSNLNACFFFVIVEALILISLSLQSLLDEPNPNSPANSQAAQLYQENKREYEKRVSAIVEQSWRDSWPHSQTMFALKCCFPFVWLCCWGIVFQISIFKFLCTLLKQVICFISTTFLPGLKNPHYD